MPVHVKQNLDVPLEYTLTFQNGCHFSVLLFTCKLVLVASFLNLNSKDYFSLNEATGANLQVNKGILKMVAILE